jgi:hypothetical protein
MKTPSINALAHCATHLALFGLLVGEHLRINQLQRDEVARRALSVDESAEYSQRRLLQHDQRLQELTTTTAELRADLASATNTIRSFIDARLDERFDELRTNDGDSRRRQAQGEPAPEPEPDVGVLVHLIQRTVSSCNTHHCPADHHTVDGAFDCDVCADMPQRCCYRDACKKCDERSGDGRRMQSGGTCDATRLAKDTNAINRECCDELTEDCTGGYPHTCNAGCGALLLPFWADCRAALGKQSAQFEGVIALCDQSAAGRPSLAEQLDVQCTDGTAAADCVPDCSKEYHGYLMLLNIEGDDFKLSCELHHGFYSWVGAAVRASARARASTSPIPGRVP